MSNLPPMPSRLPTGCAQGLLQQDRGWAVDGAASPKAASEGPTGPQAPNKQPKGQFDLAKGTSVSPAGQLRAEQGFLPLHAHNNKYRQHPAPA